LEKSTPQVRSVKANAYDSAYASALAEHAVHGAMAGLTCVSVARKLSGDSQWGISTGSDS